ncbi:hypothetical protein MASR2M15_11350 [Anaerolineales bacterium]
MPKSMQFCPVCGGTLVKRQEGGRLRPACEKCGYIHYVNPVPGVGVLLEMDNGIVLIKRKNPPHKDQWALPGGFVEVDESAEEAALRETEEETGIKAEIVELMGINSFPEGPVVSGIMIFFRVRPIGGTLQAGDDAIDAKVFQEEDLPQLPFRTHREALNQWLNHQGRFKSKREIVGDAPPYIIRSFRIDDLDEVLALLALIPDNRNLTADQWLEISFRLRESSNVEVYVAQMQDVSQMLVACVALSVVRGLTQSTCLINDMVVLPTYQRHGVGSHLFEHVILRANQLNLQSVWVNPQRANEQAQAFYMKLGFSHINMMRFKIR